jgi:hypothetical protein
MYHVSNFIIDNPYILILDFIIFCIIYIKIVPIIKALKKKFDFYNLMKL